MSRSARRWVLAVVVAILVVGVGAAVVALIGGGATVPDVTGMTRAEAAEALETAGLRAGGISEASDPEVAAGLVLRQDPAAGSEVDEDSEVALTLSSGPGTAVVPNVVGMDRATAQAALADAGFVPASALQYDLTAPAGEVVEQLPVAGQEAAHGSQVGLLVSRGRPEISVTVPDVTGLTQDAAASTLADAGLVAVAVEAYVQGVPAGEVAEQEPPAGDSVAPLSEVLVTVSLGEGTTSVEVPDVAGLAQAEATSRLEAAGLAVTAAHAWSNEVGDGLVIAQAPDPGDRVQEGGDAGILVSLGPLPSPSPEPLPSSSESAAASPSPEPSGSPETPPDGADPPEEPPELTATVPGVVGMDATEAARQLEALGLRPLLLEAPSEETPPGQVSAQLPEAGEEVPKSYPVLLLVSTGTGSRPEASPAAE